MGKHVVVTVINSYTSKYFVEVPDDWDAERIEDEFDYRDVEDRAKAFSHREGKSVRLSFSGDADGCPNVTPFVIATNGDHSGRQEMT